MASVEFRGIQKSYDQVHILKGIDLRIEDGEFLILVGPSGCGKSTLMRCVAGLEEVSAGDVLLGDQRVNDLSPRDRDVAMVFQSYALYPHMTVRKNLRFGLEVRKEVDESEIRERVAEAARMLELSDLLDRLPRQLSGGQRQRVAMGRAVVRRPRCFLFDEPLSNLDAALRTQMRVEIKKLHRRLATTIIYVTHDQVEAMTLADRIAVMNKGRLMQVGTPEALYTRPDNVFVARFLGSPAMNILPVRCGAERALKGDSSCPGLAHSASPERVSGWQEGASLWFGVRPHDLELLPPERAGEGFVQGEVEVIEPMGWEAHVHLRVGQETVIARAEVSQLTGVRVGATLGVQVHDRDVHLFDRATEEAVHRWS